MNWSKVNDLGKIYFYLELQLQKFIGDVICQEGQK